MTTPPMTLGECAQLILIAEAVGQPTTERAYALVRAAAKVVDAVHVWNDIAVDEYFGEQQLLKALAAFDKISEGEKP